MHIFENRCAKIAKRFTPQSSIFMTYNLPEYIRISSDVAKDLNHLISTLNPDLVAVLVDENTRTHCLPLLDYSFDKIIEIKSGESHKILRTCEHIWNELTKGGFTRKSLFVNLGGGVIGDMGGFAASTYKRGIRFINIPTTLLSQVDASIGGKLGIDFHGLKNHIGIFKDPNYVIVHSHFLDTLPERELKSGFAEVVKHSLIHDAERWGSLSSRDFKQMDWEEIIPRSIEIKHAIVSQDPLEGGVRKVLNFGHTLGHAIESHLLESPSRLLHGEAVAVGMILESHLSLQKGMLTKSECDSIQSFIFDNFDLPDTLPAIEDLSVWLKQDKKNEGEMVYFSLLNKIGSCAYDIIVSDELILNSLKEYNQRSNK